MQSCSMTLRNVKIETCNILFKKVKILGLQKNAVSYFFTNSFRPGKRAVVKSVVDRKQLSICGPSKVYFRGFRGRLAPRSFEARLLLLFPVSPT